MEKIICCMHESKVQIDSISSTVLTLVQKEKEIEGNCGRMHCSDFLMKNGQIDSKTQLYSAIESSLVP